MQNKKSHKFTLRIVACLAVISLSNCNSDNKQTHGTFEKSTAYFDYFTYKGNDSFYASNPLPSEHHFYNPILPGWYSDPSICRKGEDYFLVTSTFSYWPGIPIFHSKNMVNWEQIGHVLTRETQLQLNNQKTSEGLFAPAISYNSNNETFYMVVTNIRTGNFFVKTKDPFGEWSEPIWLPEVGGIDPSFFFDDDGKAYILNNGEPDMPSQYDGHRAIWIQEFNVATDSTIGPRKVLINGGINFEEKPIWIEGPHMYKINGKYYLMCAEGGTSLNHSEVILRGDSPMGSFTAWNKNPILTQRNLNANRENPVTCAGHADLLETPTGEWWATFLACRPVKDNYENLGRETFLMPVRWSEDSFPYITKENEAIPLVVKAPYAIENNPVTYGNFEKTDEFESDSLGMEWISLRASVNKYYSLSAMKGYLALQCTEASAKETNVPAFIARRMQHHNFEVNTKIHFTPANVSEKAGVLLYKDETHQYFVHIGRTDEGKQIGLSQIRPTGDTLLASSIIATDAPISIKVLSEGTHYNFFFSEGDSEYKILAEGINAHYLSTDSSWGFTGTTIGMYAVK